jgi:uncharacterized protein YdeI (YjbR/CyaY-like superfamily)
MAMITDPNDYFLDGCGRCNLYATDQCKAKKWSSPLAALRKIVLASGLNEEAKWGQPTYTLKGKNVVMLFSFKDSCGISFFKGVLLKDEHNILVPAGPNSNVARLFKTSSETEIGDIEPILHAYIEEAIQLEKAGAKVPKTQQPTVLPEIISDKLEEDSVFKKAWGALTPGRQRSYIIHLDGAKQEKTKYNRLEKAIPKILAGKGMNEY